MSGDDTGNDWIEALELRAEALKGERDAKRRKLLAAIAAAKAKEEAEAKKRRGY